jgi:hypothetical protein
MRRRRPRVFLAAATLALATAGATHAAPPIDRGSPSEGVSAPPRADRDRTLPFSGLDVALLIAGGGPLLIIGAGLKRRRSAPQAVQSPARGLPDAGLVGRG